jgi:hypothetical protein
MLASASGSFFKPYDAHAVMRDARSDGLKREAEVRDHNALDRGTAGLPKSRQIEHVTWSSTLGRHLENTRVAQRPSLECWTSRADSQAQVANDMLVALLVAASLVP